MILGLAPVQNIVGVYIYFLLVIIIVGQLTLIFIIFIIYLIYILYLVACVLPLQLGFWYSFFIKGIVEFAEASRNVVGIGPLVNFVEYFLSQFLFFYFVMLVVSWLALVIFISFIDVYI